MNLIIYSPLAVITILALVPLGARFYRFWTERKNPESLAICTLIFLLCWEVIARMWSIADLVDSHLVEVVLTGATLVIAIFFHFAVSWTKRKFPARKPTVGE